MSKSINLQTTVLLLLPSGRHASDLLAENKRLVQNINIAILRAWLPGVAEFMHASNLLRASDDAETQLSQASTRENTPDGTRPERDTQVIVLNLHDFPEDLDKGLLCGRGAGNVVKLPDHGDGASRKHFFLHFSKTSGHVLLTNTGKNGTQLDEEVVKPSANSTRILSHGSLVNYSRDTSLQVIFPRRNEEDEIAYRSGLEKMLKQEMSGIMTPPPVLRTIRDGFNVPGYFYISQARTFQGAQGRVVQLVEPRSGSLFMGKTIISNLGQLDSKLALKFAKEISIMKKLDHFALIRMVEDLQINDNSQHMAIMEFARYGALRPSYIDGDIPKLMHVTDQCLQGLVYLHENRILHRDIKPDNILVTSLDPIAVKLSDFGLSKLQEGDSTVFGQSFCGTPVYLAPEVYRNYRPAKGIEPKYSESVDIWSLGIVVMEMIVGRPDVPQPWNPGQWYKQVALKLAEMESHVDSVSVDKIVAQGLYQLVAKMLEQDGQRLNAKECLQKLRCVRSLEPTEETDGARKRKADDPSLDTMPQQKRT